MRHPIRIILATFASGLLLAISASSAVSAAGGDDSHTNIRPALRPSDSVTFHEEIVIAADKARVWELLTDFAHYRDWNP